MSTARFFGIILLFSASLYAQLSSPIPVMSGGNRQPPRTGADLYSGMPLSASGEGPVTEEYDPFGLYSVPEGLTFPDSSVNQPTSSIVSLRELEHPIPEKAVREAYEAQQFAHAKEADKAIAKLKKAIHIYPAYRDAHLNLGVEYARLGRMGDARAEFQKALDIGPPVAAIFADFALTSVALKQYREAETYAQKALVLDPSNKGAQNILHYASQH